jgi:hypothetical protein
MLSGRWIVRLTILIVGVWGCGEDKRVGPPDQPSISISPTNAVAGSSDLTLTVTGTDFASAAHNRSYVVWSVNGANTVLTTTFVSSTKLTAVVPATLLTNPGATEVFVQTGDLMGDLPLSKTATAAFLIEASSVLISISPTRAAARTPDLTLSITATGGSFAGRIHFRSSAMWLVNGSKTSLATTFVSSTQLTAVVPATLLATPVTARVFVETGDVMGDVPLQPSNAVTFSVTE